MFFIRNLSYCSFHFLFILYIRTIIYFFMNVKNSSICKLLLRIIMRCDDFFLGCVLLRKKIRSRHENKQDSQFNIFLI